MVDHAARSARCIGPCCHHTPASAHVLDPGAHHRRRYLLARQALTTLRDQDTDRAVFRSAMDDLASILVYEATCTMRVEAVEVTTPLATTAGTRVA